MTNQNNSPPIGMSPGVLGKTQMEELFTGGFITNLDLNLPEPDIDGSAFDLVLGGDAWELNEAQRPTTRELEKLKAMASPKKLVKDKTGEHFQFEPKKIYLVKLNHHIKLPKNINGRATGKSSIGRLDVITRLVTANNTEYDIVEAGYDGLLYLLILPQTFPIRVEKGGSLNQLRLFSGPPSASVITRSLIKDFGVPFWHFHQTDRSKSPKTWEEILESIRASDIAEPTLFDLTVDLEDPVDSFIFAAKKDPQGGPIDLRKKAKKSYKPSDYFEKIYIEKKEGAPSVVLTQDRFYIMKSKERLSIPLDVAVEVVAISERIGDIRIHYAGFAHPGFGVHNGQKRGTPLIFEVRATDMATRLYDGSLLARIQLFKMSVAAEKADDESPYQQQELKLSNIFKDWGK